MTKHLHLDLNGNRTPSGGGTIKISQPRLVLAIIAHYGGRCTRAQALEVLRLAGHSMKYQHGPLFTKLCKHLRLIKIESSACSQCGHSIRNILTFTKLGQRQAIPPAAMAWIEAALDAERRA
jgi:hypothetical protein